MNDIVRKEDDSVEKIIRFHSLQSGAFWKAKQDIEEEGIKADDVLLVMSVRWVDNQAHTIILRSHPRHYGDYVNIEYTDAKGNLQRSHKNMIEHRFLINDFLNKFEFEPNHQQIRQTEIAVVHANIARIQQEMDDTMSSPVQMKAIVEQQLAADEENERKKLGDNLPPALPPALYDEAVPLVTGTVQNALTQGVTAESMEAMKVAAKREHRIAEIQSKWLETKKTEINRTIKQLMPYFEEMPAAALAKTEDVREYVDKLQSGIKSLYLYTGENVEVIPVKKGESAPSNIPLTFVQKKLIVEEELAVWADLDEWFDFRSAGLFFKALNEHLELVEQIFPTERCVLVMAMTNHDLDYKDPWANVAQNRQNRRVFLMARDGENIYQIFSPVESHLGSSCLFPSQNEQDAIFQGIDGSQIKFDDIAYTDRLKNFELRALHYKRFLILICGLDHREKLFGEFYDEPQSMNFVSMAFQEKYCKFLHDDDGTGLLAATDKRPSLTEYIRSANAYMRSGSRMLCNWHSLMTPDTAPGACKIERHSSYRSYSFHANPKQDISMSIAYKKGQELCVDVLVKRQYSDSEFNCKVELNASAGKWDALDDQLAFLCLDAVDPDDLEWYVMNRKYRKGHLFYIRFFKMAIKFIRGERETENDVRERLADALDKGNIGLQEERPSLIQQAIVAWRAAQRGAPANDALKDKKSWQSLLNQMYMLAGNASNEVDEVTKFVEALGYDPLRLVVNSSGKLAVYAAPVATECDDRLEKHIWVHRINIIRGKRKIRETSRTWATLPASLASETTIHQWDNATAWTGKQSVFNSYNAKQRIFERIDKSADILKMFSGPMNRETFAPVFDEWRNAMDAINATGNIVTKPDLLIPFGYRLGADKHDFLCVCVKSPEQLLFKLAPDEQSRNAVMDAYIQWYKYKDEPKQILIDSVKIPTHFLLYSSGEANISNGRLFSVAGYPYRMLDARVEPSRFADALAFYRVDLDRTNSKRELYVSPAVIGESGDVCIDELLNNQMPDSYQPVDLVHVRLNDKHYRFATSNTDNKCARYAQSGEVIKYIEWYDIADRDIPTETLVSGIISNDMTVERYPFNNSKEAHSYVKHKYFHNEFKPVAAIEGLPDEALPPAGVERLIRD